MVNMYPVLFFFFFLHSLICENVFYLKVQYVACFDFVIISKSGNHNIAVQRIWLDSKFQVCVYIVQAQKWTLIQSQHSSSASSYLKGNEAYVVFDYRL